MAEAKARAESALIIKTYIKGKNGQGRPIKHCRNQERDKIGVRNLVKAIAKKCKDTPPKRTPTRLTPDTGFMDFMSKESCATANVITMKEFKENMIKFGPKTKSRRVNKGK